MKSYLDDVLTTYRVSLLQEGIQEKFRIGEKGDIVDETGMPLTEEHHYGIAMTALRIIQEEHLNSKRTMYLSIAEYHAGQLQSQKYQAELQQGIGDVKKEIEFIQSEYGTDLSDLTSREGTGGF